MNGLNVGKLIGERVGLGGDGEEDGCIVVGTLVGSVEGGDRIDAVGLSECGRLVGPGEKGLGKCVPLGKEVAAMLR